MVFDVRKLVIITGVLLLAGIGIWLLIIKEGRIPETPMAEKPPLIQKEKKSLDQSRAFFPYYRMQRERVRSQQVELLREITSHPNADEKSKQEALLRMLSITNAMETELKVESYLKALGFQEGVVILQDKTATIVIYGRLEEGEETDRLKEQVSRMLKTEPEKVLLVVKSPLA